MNTVQLMQAFVDVVRCGSFTRAAEQANLTTSMISKQISTLERHLGCQLLNRTTRRLGLTDAGEIYYESCLRILEDILRAEQSISGMQQAPRGAIKVRVPHTVAALHFADVVAAFTVRYPGISVTMMIDQHSVPSIDIIARNFDLILMFGPISSTTLTVRELAKVIWAPYAAPSYIALHGRPRRPDDLSEHNCLSHLAVSPDQKWELRGRRASSVIKVSGSLNVNSVMVLQQAATSGLGIALLPSFSLDGKSSPAGLVRLLPGYRGPERNLQLAFVRERLLPRRTSLFIDFLVERFRTPMWDQSV